MAKLTLKSYLRWAKEFIARAKKNIPKVIIKKGYNRRQDLDYYRKLRFLTRNFTKIYPLHTITNEPLEKKRFFSALYQNKIYNPEFHYSQKPSRDFQKCKKLIRALDDFSRTLSFNTLGQIYRRRIFDAQKAIVLATLTQKEGFSWASREYYDFKPPSRLGLPLELTFPYNHKERIEAYEISYLTQKVLSKIGLPHKARLSKVPSSLPGLATTNRSIKIGAGTFRSPAHIIRSLAHEILGHAIASANASHYPAYFAHRGTASSLFKEEGIAVKIGQLAYQNLKILLPRALQSRREDFIAHLRIKTIIIARKKSFYETFLALTKLNVNKELAWELTRRAKRGLKTTALAGANYHDFLYYAGLKKIEVLLLKQKVPAAENILFLNKLIQGKFDLAEFGYLKQHFPLHQNFNLPKAFNIFIQEFKKIVKTKIIK